MALGRIPSETLKTTGTCASAVPPNNTSARRRRGTPLRGAIRLEVMAMELLVLPLACPLPLCRCARNDTDHEVEPFAVAVAVQRDIQSDDPRPWVCLGCGFHEHGIRPARLAGEFAFQDRRLGDQARRGVHGDPVNLFARPKVA